MHGVVRLSGSEGDGAQDTCGATFTLGPSCCHHLRPRLHVPFPAVVATGGASSQVWVWFPRMTPQAPAPTARPTYLHCLRPHVEGVQPVAEARVAVELGGPLPGGHAQLALPLLANVPDQLRLRGGVPRREKRGSLGARACGSPKHDMGSSGKHEPVIRTGACQLPLCCPSNRVTQETEGGGGRGGGSGRACGET